jgi:glutathione S-transferase
MLILYYYPLCPLSQKIQLILKIWSIPYEKVQITNKTDYIKIRNDLKFSPLPLLKINENSYLTESLVISNYLNYHYNNQQICFNSQSIEAITDIHFYRDVYMNVVYERTLKTIFVGIQPPNINKIKEGLEHLNKYLNFFESILQEHNWLNKFQFSVGDISLFTQLMCLDYCGQIQWLRFPEIKKWYMRIKCKKEVIGILKEHISIFPPASHYELFDF